jgi:hypothetical protein
MKLVHCLCIEYSGDSSSTYGFGRLKPHCPSNVQITVIEHELNIDGRIYTTFFSLGLATNFRAFHLSPALLCPQSSSVHFGRVFDLYAQSFKNILRTVTNINKYALHTINNMNNTSRANTTAKTSTIHAITIVNKNMLHAITTMNKNTVHAITDMKKEGDIRHH